MSSHTSVLVSAGRGIECLCVVLAQRDPTIWSIYIAFIQGFVVQKSNVLMIRQDTNERKTTTNNREKNYVLWKGQMMCYNSFLTKGDVFTLQKDFNSFFLFETLIKQIGLGQTQRWKNFGWFFLAKIRGNRGILILMMFNGLCCSQNVLYRKNCLEF